MDRNWTEIADDNVATTGSVNLQSDTILGPTLSTSALRIAKASAGLQRDVTLTNATQATLTLSYRRQAINTHRLAVQLVNGATVTTPTGAGGLTTDAAYQTISLNVPASLLGTTSTLRRRSVRWL